MSLKSTNPTKTNSWNNLRNHFNDIKDIHIDTMFTLILVKFPLCQALKTSIIFLEKMVQKTYLYP